MLEDGRVDRRGKAAVLELYMRQALWRMWSPSMAKKTCADQYCREGSLFSTSSCNLEWNVERLFACCKMP